MDYTEMEQRAYEEAFRDEVEARLRDVEGRLARFEYILAHRSEDGMAIVDECVKILKEHLARDPESRAYAIVEPAIADMLALKERMGNAET